MATQHVTLALFAVALVILIGVCVRAYRWHREEIEMHVYRGINLKAILRPLPRQ